MRCDGHAGEGRSGAERADMDDGKQEGRRVTGRGKRNLLVTVAGLVVVAVISVVVALLGCKSADTVSKDNLGKSTASVAKAKANTDRKARKPDDGQTGQGTTAKITPKADIEVAETPEPVASEATDEMTDEQAHETTSDETTPRADEQPVAEPEPDLVEEDPGQPTETPAEPEAPASPTYKSEFARMISNGEVGSIRLIGDSITAGMGCDGFSLGSSTGRVIYDGPRGRFLEMPTDVGCWANEMRMYALRNGVDDFTNAGICGAKMQWLAESPDSWIGDGADVIVVMLGTNDLVTSPQDEYRTNAEVGLGAVSQRCRCLIVMSPPINARFDSVNLYGTDVTDRILRDICSDHGWCFVSQFDTLSFLNGDMCWDMCHPTTQGSDKMWSKMMLELGLGQYG